MTSSPTASARRSSATRQSASSAAPSAPKSASACVVGDRATGRGLRERRLDVGVEPLGLHVAGRPRLGDLERVEIAVDGAGVVAEPRIGALREHEIDRAGLPGDLGVLPRDRLGALPLDGPAVRAHQRGDGRPHLAGEVRIGPRRELRIDREAFAELLAPGRRGGRERLDRGPGLLGVHVVGGERRHAAPVVDPRIQQPRLLVGIGQVRRRLQVHPRSEDDARGRDGREELLVARLGRRVHRGPGLGPEVLDDHLLHVAVPAVQVADLEEALGALAEGLPDPDEDARRERDREPPRVLDRAEAHGGELVRRPEVRPAALGQARARGLEHHAHRCRHVTQARLLLVRHHPGVEVREQPRLLDHPDRDRPHVVERGPVAALVEPVAGGVVPVLGAVAQREERFLAAHRSTGIGDRHDLLGREER